MKEKSAQQSPDRTAARPAEERGGRPPGVALAVIFDWAIVVQLLVMPGLAWWLHLPPPLRLPQLPALWNALLSLVAALPFATLIAFFGEGVRRGWPWTRTLQIAFNILLFLAGLATVYTFWLRAQAGDYWPVVTLLLLAGGSLVIVWRLNRRETARWFATVASEEARRLHGGLWLWSVLLLALLVGVLQALAALYR